VDAYFQSCRVFIAPLRYGGGIKIKNLHAMANGIPVVTTKVGIEGIEGVSPENMLVADSPAKIASTVVSLLADPQRAERIGMNGREAVGEWYSWERTTAQLEEIYKRVLNPG